MILLSLLLFTLPGATQLKALRNTDLAAVLCYQEELASTVDDRDASLNIRIYRAPESMGECGGSVRSCPNVDLYFAVSESDLDSQPAVFRLPRAKGWQFVNWLSTCSSSRDEPMLGFLVRTTLPDANIDPIERSAWTSLEYEICLTSRSAKFVARQHNNAVQRPYLRSAAEGNR